MYCSTLSFPCPIPTPRACSNTCPWSQWCHPTNSSSVVPFSSCLQSFPASGSFPMSQFFPSGGQSIGASASASVLPVNIQDWFPLEFFFFYFILLYDTVLVLTYINMNPPWVYMCSQSWTPLPPPSPYHPSGSSQCTSPKHPVSCIEPRLVIHFLYDIIHVSMPFSQIIPPSPTESKSLFYTSVSLLLSRIQGYRYHLSKFHIYVLVYCIGVFLSGLLHSV